MQVVHSPRWSSQLSTSLWAFLLWILSFVPPLPSNTHQPLIAKLPEKLPLTLVSLPDEILAEMCIYLDLSSLLSLRECCKSLYPVTKSPYVWRKLTRRICEEYDVERPEGELHLYKIHELESWIMRRKLARDAWRARTRSRPSARIVELHVPNLSEHRSAFHYLLPGGRWLLIAYPSSYMCALDLDSVDPQSRLLFDPSKADKTIPNERGLIVYSFWNNRHNPRTFFRVAGTVINNRQPRTFIYDLELSDHTASSTLVATELLRFRKPVSTWAPRKTCLNRRYFVEVCTHPQQIAISEAIVVYQYNDALREISNPLLQPVAQIRFREGSIWVVEFIYDNVFVVQTRQGGLRVFNIQTAQDCGSNAASCFIQLLHTISLSYHTSSHIRWSPGVSHMVTVSLKGEFQGVWIPHDRTKPPVIAMLGQHNAFEFQMHGVGKKLGVSTSLSMQDSHEVICVLNHNLRSSADAGSRFEVTRVPIQTSGLSHCSKLITFSEDIGRVILFSDLQRHYLVVIDFVPYPDS